MSKIICGMNGFGRFGLHMLNYYLELMDKSNFQLKYINDDVLDINKALDIIVHDPYVKIYNNFNVKIRDNFLVFNDEHEVEYTNHETEKI